MTRSGIVEQSQSFRDPGLLATRRRWVVASFNANAQGIFEPHADLEEVGAALIDLGVLPVPKDVAPFRIEKDERQDLNGIAQSRVGPLCFRKSGFRFGLRLGESGL